MDQYNGTAARLHPPNGLADGELYEAAGSTHGSVVIAAIWESKDDFHGFLSNTVMASMPVDRGLTRQPAQRTAEIENL